MKPKFVVTKNTGSETNIIGYFDKERDARDAARHLASMYDCELPDNDFGQDDSKVYRSTRNQNFSIKIEYDECFRNSITGKIFSVLDYLYQYRIYFIVGGLVSAFIFMYFYSAYLDSHPILHEREMDNLLLTLVWLSVGIFVFGVILTTGSLHLMIIYPVRAILIFAAFIVFAYLIYCSLLAFLLVPPLIMAAKGFKYGS